MIKLDIKTENGKKYVEYRGNVLEVEITKKGVNTEADIFDMNPAARAGTASIEVKAKVGNLTCNTIVDDLGDPELLYDIFVEDKDNNQFEVFFKLYHRAGDSTVSMGII